MTCAQHALGHLVAGATIVRGHIGWFDQLHACMLGNICYLFYSETFQLSLSPQTIESLPLLFNQSKSSTLMKCSMFSAH